MAGSAECKQCSVGKYGDPHQGNQTSEEHCIECLPGRFQNLGGKTQCQSCPAGMRAANESATHCVPCGSGSYQDQASHQHQACVPCSVCAVDEEVAANCTAAADTVCVQPPPAEDPGTAATAVAAVAPTDADRPPPAPPTEPVAEADVESHHSPVAATAKP